MKLYYIKWFFSLFLIVSSVFAGEEITEGKSKAMICSACHGVDGVSINPEWPNLAGQHAQYLIKQLKDYQGGKTRTEPTMSPFVANLSAKDIEDIAKFYATLDKHACAQKKDNLNRGADIYRRGDIQKHITACIACHGPDGSGNAQAGFPLVAGQNARYTLKQLHAFRDKTRKNDISSIMHDITSHMSNEDMQAVADYICSLG